MDFGLEIELKNFPFLQKIDAFLQCCNGLKENKGK